MKGSSFMAAAIFIPLSEYLETVYRPDREYIDGEVRERNLGETDHSRLQMLISNYLCNREKSWGIVVLPEQRVQVKPTRLRVPDISVVLGELPSTPILHEPPFLCVEVLSKDDSMDSIEERVDDYLAFGVPNVWVINPRTRRAYHYTAEGIREMKDGILRTTRPDIQVSIAELESR